MSSCRHVATEILSASFVSTEILGTPRHGTQECAVNLRWPYNSAYMPICMLHHFHSFVPRWRITFIQTQNSLRLVQSMSLRQPSTSTDVRWCTSTYAHVAQTMSPSVSHRLVRSWYLVESEMMCHTTLLIKWGRPKPREDPGFQLCSIHVLFILFYVLLFLWLLDLLQMLQTLYGELRASLQGLGPSPCDCK